MSTSTRWTGSRSARGTLVGESTLIISANHAAEGDRSLVEPLGPIRIGDDVFIGQGCVIFGGVTIGDGATVGAGSVVVKDVPAGASVIGVPARVVRAPSAVQTPAP